MSQEEEPLDALRRENSRLRQQLFETEYRFQRLERELREVKQSGALRVGRLVSRVLPRGLKQLLYRPFRRSEPSEVLDHATPVGSAPARSAADRIRFSVIVPVYGHARHLTPMIESLLAQSRPAEEIILVDDHSPDPAVREVLQRHSGRPTVQVLFQDANRGVSATTNLGLAHATGTHLAFVDCDDQLVPDALEKVERRIRTGPEADFIYTDRIDIDQDGHELQRWTFAERAARPPHQTLMEGMFTSHLKVVSAAALRDVGLFRARYDLAQDYDLALRLSERHRLAHLPEAVYLQRMHPSQQSQQQRQLQAAVLERIRADSRRRGCLRAGSDSPLVSVVVEAEGADDAARVTRDSVLARLEGRFELLVSRGASLPRPSNERASRAARVLGLAPGEDPASRLRGDYVLTLQRGLQLEDPELLVKVLERLEASPELAACCCKSVIAADDLVWSNGGQLQRDASGDVTFELDDHGAPGTALRTLEERRAGWLPGGAALWRRAAYQRFPRAPDVAPCLQEQERALRLRAAGLELGNCPTAEVRLPDLSIPDAPVDIAASLRLIFQRHGVVLRDPFLDRLLGWDPTDAPRIRHRITGA